MRSLLFYAFLSMVMCGPAVAQSCADSDGGSQPNVSGVVTITPGSTIYRDYCTADGGQVREMTCSGRSLASSFIPCPEGCIDGACASHSLDKEGCYLKLSLKVDLAAAVPAITVQSATPIVGRFGQSAHPIPDGKTTDGFEADLYDAQGVLLGRYPFLFNPRIYVEGQLPKVISQSTTIFYIPFYSKLSSLQFVRQGKVVGGYVFRPSQVVCKRPCVAPGRSGWTATQRCCPGPRTVPINKESFMCVLSPSPSPTPIAPQGTPPP